MFFWWKELLYNLCVWISVNKCCKGYFWICIKLVNCGKHHPKIKIYQLQRPMLLINTSLKDCVIKQWHSYETNYTWDIGHNFLQLNKLCQEVNFSEMNVTGCYFSYIYFFAWNQLNKSVRCVWKLTFRLKNFLISIQHVWESYRI